MYCTKCGTQLSDDAIFCINCGEKTGQPAFYGQNIIDDFSNSAVSASFYKNRAIAIILRIVFGQFGVHNFYLGYNTKGAVQLVLFFCSAGIVSRIWSLWERFLLITGGISTDANGNPLK